MNFNNIFGGIFGLIAYIVLVYLLYQPISTFLAFLPTELQVVLGGATLLFFVFGPMYVIGMFVSDDAGVA